MNLRSRLGQLARAAHDMPLDGQISLVVCNRVGSDPEGRPAGEYPNVAGNVVDVVFAGAGPDPAVMARLQARMPPWGLVISCYRDVIPLPAEIPA